MTMRETYLTPSETDNRFNDNHAIFTRVLPNGDTYQAQGLFYEANDVMSEILRICWDLEIYDASNEWVITLSHPYEEC